MSSRHHLLIIYDICDTKNRNKIVKYLNGYGFRVQKSSFEAVVSTAQYKSILKKIRNCIDEETDSLRIYKMIENNEITVYGKQYYIEDEELIIF